MKSFVILEHHVDDDHKKSSLKFHYELAEVITRNSSAE